MYFLTTVVVSDSGINQYVYSPVGLFPGKLIMAYCIVQKNHYFSIFITFIDACTCVPVLTVYVILKF